MSYIGNQPAESYASFLTETFTVSATANYTLSHSVTNENEIRLVINGVVQQPGSGKAYTASGTTLTLSSATASGDSMYAVYLGRALQTVNPPAGSVGASQISDGSIALGKLSATGTKSSSTFLRGDNTFAEAGGGIEMADMWRITSNLAAHTTNANTTITANWERADAYSPGFIGTGLTESSGTFTFPSTGIYQIYLQYLFQASGSGDYHGVHIRTTSNNSTYNSVTETYVMLSGNYNSASSQYIFDVTNTSTHKLQFCYFVESAASLLGNTNQHMTGFTVVRLGDT